MYLRWLGRASRYSTYAYISCKTPNWDKIKSTYANSFLYSSAQYVGLPPEQMGNSEVGHEYWYRASYFTKFTQINQAIEQDNLKNNHQLVKQSQSLNKLVENSIY